MGKKAHRRPRPSDAPNRGDLRISGGFAFVVARFIEPSLMLEPKRKATKGTSPPAPFGEGGAHRFPIGESRLIQSFRVMQRSHTKNCSEARTKIRPMGWSVHPAGERLEARTKIRPMGLSADMAGERSEPRTKILGVGFGVHLADGL